MHHYTIDTGHSRDTSRDEIDDAAIELLTPLLSNGDHSLPHPFERYRLRVTIVDGTLAATVYSGPAPLVTTYVVTDAAGLAEVLRITGAIPAAPLTPPAIIVQTHPSIVADRDAIGWLGDFERCLGWAWVETQIGKSPRR